MEVKTILIVDDELDLRDILKLQLEDEGYQVLTAPNGHTGLQVASTQRPDLIVLDVTMPGMDGYEVCERLKGNPQTEHIPIIMLTGRSMEEGLETALTKKASWYTEKPFDFYDLLFQIEEVLHLPHKYQGHKKKAYPSSHEFL